MYIYKYIFLTPGAFWNGIKSGTCSFLLFVVVVVDGI